MTYEEFKRELYRNLQTRDVLKGGQILLLEKGSIFTCEEIVQMIRLINWGEYGREEATLKEDIICIVVKGSGLQGMLHWSVRSIFERFKREGWQGILPEIMSKIHRMNSGNHPGTASLGMDCRQLIVRALPYPYYRQELTEGIYWLFGDIALTLYLLAYDSAEELHAVRMNRNMLRHCSETDEMLLTNALLNTSVKMPPRLYYGTDLISECHKEYGVFMNGEKGTPIKIHPDSEQEGIHGYRVTTAGKINSAIALFYPGVKERLAEILDGDYYVGFPDVREARVYPARYKFLNELKVSMQQMNLVFEKRELLTNRVYRYSCKRRALIEV